MALTFRKSTGDEGEQHAKKILIKNGYKIIKTNYRCKVGEIDIIARDNHTLVFIEVRTKKSTTFGDGADSITERKKRKIRQVAEFYIVENNISNTECRFDVIALHKESNIFQTEIYKNAF